MNKQNTDEQELWYGQPHWSDLPILVLTHGGSESPVAAWAMQALDNVMLLERPVHQMTLLSAVRAAVKHRRRQYQLREYLAEQKRQQEALREGEQRLRATFENAASGIVEVDEQGRLVAVNDRLCQMLGYRREELLGKSMPEVTYPEDRRHFDELNAQLRDGRIPMFECEERCLTREGSPLWAHVARSAVRDRAGRFLYSIATLVDISARKAAEAQVRLQAAALEAAPNAVSLSTTDALGTIVWVNAAFTKLTGYSAEEAIGHSHHLLSSGRQDQAFYRELWETIERGEVWSGELINRRKDGTLYHEEMGITPLRDEDGQITHFVAVKQDITARKRAEESLRSSEEHYRLLVDSIRDHAVVVINTEGRIAAWNPGAERIFGWTKEEITGQSIDVLFTPEDRSARTAARELAQARDLGSAGGDRWQIRKDGTRFYGAGSVGLDSPGRPGQSMAVVGAIHRNWRTRDR